MDLEEQARKVEALREREIELTRQHRDQRLKLGTLRMAQHEEERELFGDPEPDLPELYEDDDEPSLEEQIEFGVAAVGKTKSSLDDVRAQLNAEELALNDGIAARASSSADWERAEASQWNRRFHTSLAIGHGAAFAAIVTHAFDKDTAQLAVQYALWPLIPFGIGLLTGGAIPIALARKSDSLSVPVILQVADTARRDGRALAIISAFCFLVGVIASVGSVIGMAFR